MRVRLSGNSLFGFVIALLAFTALSLLMCENPQFIAWARTSGLTFSIPSRSTLNPLSNHLSYTLVGPSTSASLTKKFYAEAGKSITIQYQIGFENHSAPYLSLYQPGVFMKPIWREKIKRSAGGATITAPATGFYEMNFSPWGYNGSFDISWAVK